MDIVETREREFVYMNMSSVIENGEAALDKENYKEVERDITSTGSLSEDIYIGKNNDDEYDFTWGSLKSYKDISQEKLVIENIIEPSSISGYRIVDIDYFLKNSITLQYNHSKKCTEGRLDFHEEKRKALTSSLIFKCNVCNKQEILYSENPKKEAVIKAAVWGTLSTGSTYSHMKKFLSYWIIPTMSQNMFFDSQRTLGYVWKESLWQNMQLAGKEEYEIAKANGRIDSDEVPYITVLLDGGWSKGSYGHSYNALSGVVNPLQTAQHNATNREFEEYKVYV